jgi:hypothetical protein
MIYKESKIPVVRVETNAKPYPSGVCSYCFKEGTPTIETTSADTHLQTPYTHITTLNMCRSCHALLGSLYKTPGKELHNGVLQLA